MEWSKVLLEFLGNFMDKTRAIKISARISAVLRPPDFQPVGSGQMELQLHLGKDKANVLHRCSTSNFLKNLQVTIGCSTWEIDRPWTRSPSL